MRLPLTGSYRSRPELLAVIGHVFGQRFDERDFQPPHALRTDRAALASRRPSCT